MSFFKKIGKAVKKATSTVSKVAGSVVKVAGGAVAGVGKLTGSKFFTTVGNVAKKVGTTSVNIGKAVDKIGAKTKGAITDAANNAGYVDAGEIENTIAQEAEQNGISLSSSELQKQTKSLAAEIATNNNLPVDSSSSSVNVTFMDKLKVYIKKPITWVCVAAAAVVSFLLFRGKKKRRY